MRALKGVRALDEAMALFTEEEEEGEGELSEQEKSATEEGQQSGGGGNGGGESDESDESDDVSTRSSKPFRGLRVRLYTPASSRRRRSRRRKRRREPPRRKGTKKQKAALQRRKEEATATTTKKTTTKANLLRLGSPRETAASACSSPALPRLLLRCPRPEIPVRRPSHGEGAVRGEGLLAAPRRRARGTRRGGAGRRAGLLGRRRRRRGRQRRSFFFFSFSFSGGAGTTRISPFGCTALRGLGRGGLGRSEPPFSFPIFYRRRRSFFRRTAGRTERRRRRTFSSPVAANACRSPSSCTPSPRRASLPRRSSSPEVREKERKAGRAAERECGLFFYRGRRYSRFPLRPLPGLRRNPPRLGLHPSCPAPLLLAVGRRRRRGPRGGEGGAGEGRSGSRDDGSSPGAGRRGGRQGLPHRFPVGGRGGGEKARRRGAAAGRGGYRLER